MSTKRAEPPGGEATSEDVKPKQREDAPREDDRAERPETEARARELAERHRETLDYLAKN